MLFFKKKNGLSKVFLIDDIRQFMEQVVFRTRTQKDYFNKLVM